MLLKNSSARKVSTLHRTDFSLLATLVYPITLLVPRNRYFHVCPNTRQNRVRHFDERDAFSSHPQFSQYLLYLYDSRIRRFSSSRRAVRVTLPRMKDRVPISWTSVSLNVLTTLRSASLRSNGATWSQHQLEDLRSFRRRDPQTASRRFHAYRKSGVVLQPSSTIVDTVDRSIDRRCAQRLVFVVVRNSVPPIEHD